MSYVMAGGARTSSSLNLNLLRAFPMQWELNRTILVNNEHAMSVNFYKLFKNSGAFRQMLQQKPSDYVLSYFPANIPLFEIALYFCHMEEYSVTEENILECLKASADYQVYQLFQKCYHFIKKNLTVRSSWRYHRAATELSLPELSSSVNAFLSKNIIACCQEPGFMHLSVEELAQLLHRSDLNVRLEMTVLVLIQKWARGDWPTRSQQLQNIVHVVRSSLITSEQIEQVPERLFQESEALASLKNRILAQDNLLLPTQRKRSLLLYRDIPYPRMPHEAVVVFGGYEHHRISQKSYLFDPRSRRWFTYSSPKQHPLALPQSLMSFGIAISYQRNTIYLVGGEERQEQASQKLYVFHLLEKRWELQSPMYDERRDLAVAMIDDDCILAIGGDNNRQVLQSVEKYLLDQRQWIRMQSMLLQRSGAACSAIGHKVYVFGGYTVHPMNELTSTCEVYDADLDQWSYIAPMSDVRYYIQSVVCPASQYIYVLGGGDEMFWSTVERYDAHSNTWIGMPAMITQRADFAACVMENEIYCMGGGNDTSSTCEVESWRMDSPSSVWRSSVPLPVKVWGHRCVCIRGADVISSLLPEQEDARSVSRAVLENMVANTVEELVIEPLPVTCWGPVAEACTSSYRAPPNNDQILSRGDCGTGQVQRGTKHAPPTVFMDLGPTEPSTSAPTSD